MPKGGMLNKALRLGMSPAGVRGVSKFLGLPGLALSLGYEGYDHYKNQTQINNLLNKEVDNPFKKGKIVFGDLMNRIQVKGYGLSLIHI